MARQRRQYGRDERERILAMIRATGEIWATSARAGVPYTTIKRWLADEGWPSTAAGIRAMSNATGAASVANVALTDGDAAGDSVNAHAAVRLESDARISEDHASIMAALVKLDRVRHAYLDRMQEPDAVARTNARDASSIVRDATSQIQLLTGRPGHIGETRVRYVDRGALRDLGRRMLLEERTGGRPSSR